MIYDDNPEETIDKNVLEYLELLELTFVANPAGKKLLSLLESNYFYAPTTPPLEQAAKYPEWFVYIREGENRFLRKILGDLEWYKQYKERKQ